MFGEKSLADLLEGDFPSLYQDVIGRELAVFESVLGDLVWRTLLTKAEPAVAFPPAPPCPMTLC